MDKKFSIKTNTTLANKLADMLQEYIEFKFIFEDIFKVKITAFGPNEFNLTASNNLEAQYATQGFSKMVEFMGEVNDNFFQYFEKSELNDVTPGDFQLGEQEIKMCYINAQIDVNNRPKQTGYREEFNQHNNADDAYSTKALEGGQILIFPKL